MNQNKENKAKQQLIGVEIGPITLPVPMVVIDAVVKKLVPEKYPLTYYIPLGPDENGEHTVPRMGSIVDTSNSPV